MVAKQKPPANYQRYLASPHWKTTRQRALDEAEGRCRLCNGVERLEVHHRTYERLGCERPADVVVLCASCHRHYHRKGKKKADGWPVRRTPEEELEYQAEIARAREQIRLYGWTTGSARWDEAEMERRRSKGLTLRGWPGIPIEEA